MTKDANISESPTCSFRTKDLNQAAFIWCQAGTDLTRLDGDERRENGRTVYFVFTLSMSEVALGKLIFEYANRKTCVEPQSYVQAQSSLRDLLHGNLRRSVEQSQVSSKQEG